MTTTTDRIVPGALPFAILAAALLLGVLGDVLFRPGALGLNVFLWTAALAALLLTLARSHRIALTGEGRWLLIPALVLAGAVAWRASPALQAMNVAAVLLTLAVAAFRLRDGKVRVGAVSEYAWSLFVAIASAGMGAALLLLRDVRWERLPLQRSPVAAGLTRGFVIAVPLIALFGGLFVAADAVFSDLLSNVLAFDPATLASHIFWIAAWSWVAASVLWQCLLEPAPEPPALEPRPAFRLGPIEVTTVLGALDLLFLGFVIVQVRYLFGGAGHVEVTDGLTYAEYARRGFFELLAVAALVLPVILGIHWLLRDSSRPLKLAFRLFATGLALLVFVVISSAVKRMDAYVDEFGLTELRLYSTAFIAWLALVFAWLLLTVIRGRRERFAFGAAMAGFLVLAALNVANPDAFIADTNTTRASEGRRFDPLYAAQLSPDATPTLIAALPHLSPDDRCALARDLLDDDAQTGDWRTWNWSRSHAAATVAANRATLESACPP